jgi:hypothetical protein
MINYKGPELQSKGFLIFGFLKFSIQYINVFCTALSSPEANWKHSLSTGVHSVVRESIINKRANKRC